MVNGKDALEDRLDALERSSGSMIPPRWRDAIVVLSPIALALMGFMFNERLNEAQTEIDRTELEIRRIEAAQNIMGEIFDGEYEKALLMERLLTLLIEDKEIVSDVSDTLAAFYRNRIESLTREGQRLSSDAADEIMRLTAAARTFDYPAARDIDEASRIHVVIQSLVKTEIAKEKSIETAQALNEDYHFPAAVWESRTPPGYYAVTLGFLPIPEARTVLERAQALGKAPADAYMTKGDRFIRRVWPPVPKVDE